MPECDRTKRGKEDCTRRDLWLGFYHRFRVNINEICQPLRDAATQELDEADGI